MTLSTTFSTLTQQLQMALKRRSQSTVSSLSWGEKLTYQTLHELSTPDITESPSPPSSSIDLAVPKKRLFFKKSNVYNFIRKRAKTDLKSSASISNLVDVDRTSQTFTSTQLGSISDPGQKVKIRMLKNNAASKDPKYVLFASFSFGEDKLLKSRLLGRNVSFWFRGGKRFFEGKYFVLRYFFGKLSVWDSDFLIRKLSKLFLIKQ